MKQFFLCLLAVAAMTFAAEAQIQTPQPSPTAKFETKVGLTDVTIEYSRPSVKGRTIYGDLVPYGQMWRTGANASTKITFSEDVKVGGLKLEKGTYALYTIPNENDWTIIFHKNLSYWGTGGEDYNADEDAARFNVKPKKLGFSLETFVIDVNNVTNNSATIDLVWENTVVMIPVEFNTTSQVQESIDKMMAGPSGRDYYQAAQFYLAEKSNLETALEYINTAVNDKDYSRFWSQKLKSEIQAALGDYKGAIETAKVSREMAEKEGNMNYVKMNDDNMAKWMKK